MDAFSNAIWVGNQRTLLRTPYPKRVQCPDPVRDAGYLFTPGSRSRSNRQGRSAQGLARDRVLLHRELHEVPELAQALDLREVAEAVQRDEERPQAHERRQVRQRPVRGEAGGAP